MVKSRKVKAILLTQGPIQYSGGESEEHTLESLKKIAEDTATLQQAGHDPGIFFDHNCSAATQSGHISEPPWVETLTEGSLPRRKRFVGMAALMAELTLTDENTIKKLDAGELLNLSVAIPRRDYVCTQTGQSFGRPLLEVSFVPVGANAAASVVKASGLLTMPSGASIGPEDLLLSAGIAQADKEEEGPLKAGLSLMENYTQMWRGQRIYNLFESFSQTLHEIREESEISEQAGLLRMLIEDLSSGLYGIFGIAPEATDGTDDGVFTGSKPEEERMSQDEKPLDRGGGPDQETLQALQAMQEEIASLKAEREDLSNRLGDQEAKGWVNQYTALHERFQAAAAQGITWFTNRERYGQYFPFPVAEAAARYSESKAGGDTRLPDLKEIGIAIQVASEASSPISQGSAIKASAPETEGRTDKLLSAAMSVVNNRIPEPKGGRKA